MRVRLTQRELTELKALYQMMGKVVKVIKKVEVKGEVKIYTYIEVEI